MKAPGALAGANTGAKGYGLIVQRRDEIEAIKTRSLAVYGRYLGDLKPSGNNGKRLQVLCPFHDDRNPSLTINRDTGRFRCWSCDVSGDALDFIMRHDGVAFPEAKQRAAQIAGVALHRIDPGHARRLASAKRAATERANELVGWRDDLFLALRAARDSAWDGANEIDRATIGADPQNAATWKLVAEAVERRRIGDAIDQFCDDLRAMSGEGLTELRAQLEECSGARGDSSC